MKSKKAEMGIGTLIIFIAMILVAAVAAGVLIQTSTSLQSQALLTGERSKEQVGTSMSAIEVSATNGTDQNVENFYETVKLSPGSEEVRLSDVVLSFETSDNVAFLQYGGTTCSPDTAYTADGSAGFYTNSTSEDGYYHVEYLLGGDNEGYITNGDVVKICYQSPGSVAEDSSIKVSMVPKVGNSLVLDLSTPSVMTDYLEHIYP